MATPEQIAANRRNAAKSTGPVTEAGKQISSRNATTHGMTSSTLIIPGESIDQFNALKSDLLDRLHPVGELEEELAEAVVLAQWRHRRMLRFEAAFWQYETETYLKQCVENGTPEPDPAMAAARLFSDPASHRKLSLLLRYLNSAAKDYAKALDTFNAAQQHRLESEEEEISQEGNRETSEEGGEFSPEEIDAFLDAREILTGSTNNSPSGRNGFVPQPPPKPGQPARSDKQAA